MRNSVVCGIIVPQYVNLHVYDYGFYTTVTFHFEERKLEYLQEVCKQTTIYGGSIYTFSKVNKRGKRLYYISIRRDYNDLNQLNYACYTQADSDRRYLMVKTRKAKIEVINDEINNIL